MTIDEAIKYYEDKNVVLNEEEALANTIAIATMRKYKKIEEIMLEDFDNIHPFDREYYRVSKIHEVLQEGIND